MKKIGKRIQILLSLNEISQRELAKRINVTEVTISRYINGFREPKGEIILKMAQTLNTTTDYLLGMSDNNSRGKFIGAKLKKLRNDRTYSEFASEITKRSGTYIPSNILIHLEEEKLVPSEALLTCLADSYNLSINYFFENALDFLDKETRNWVSNPDNKEILETIHKNNK
jgi:transcriptional regulator with XRE-family HTH domain